MSISPQVMTTLLCFGMMALLMGLALWAILGSHNTTVPYHDHKKTPFDETIAKVPEDWSGGGYSG
jgi:hypothetical protein